MPRRNIPIHQMNVVPYIDVMLVLLVIFMITAPLVQTTSIELPQSNAPVPTQNIKKPIRVEMLSTGSYNIILSDQKKVVAKDDVELLQRLTSLLETKKMSTIYFAASPDTSYGKVIEKVDILRALPHIKISLLMQKKSL